MKIPLFNAFFKNTSIVLVSNMASRSIGLITFILLAKHLEVNQYGALSLILAIVVTLTDLVNSGLNASVTRFTAIFKAKGQDDKIISLWGTSIINVTVLSAGTIVLVFVLKHLLNQLFIKTGNYEFAIFIASIGIFSTFIFSVYAGIFQGLQKFQIYFGGTILFALIRLSLIFVLINLGILTVKNIVIIFVFSPLLPIIYFHFRLRTLGQYTPSRIIYNRSILKETFTFGRWMILWSIVTVIQSKLDLYFLGAFSTPAQVSYFDVASKFISIPVGIFAALGTVLNPKIASMDGKKIPALMSKIRAVSLLSTGMIIIGVFLVPTILHLIFGSKYEASFLILRIMLLGLIPYIWLMPLNSALFAIGKSSAFFYAASFGLTINTICSIILVPRFGALGSGISFSLISVVGAIFNYYLYKRAMGKHLLIINQSLPQVTAV